VNGQAALNEPVKTDRHPPNRTAERGITCGSRRVVAALAALGTGYWFTRQPGLKVVG